MKIFPRRTVITPNRKCVLNEHVRNFDKLITTGPFAKSDKFRNFIGLPVHAITCLYALSNISPEHSQDLFFCLVGAKVNYDFIQFIRNINKRKAAALSQYLKLQGIENFEHIEYAVKKYFKKLGMPLYPVTHPKGMRQIVENGTYPKSFETGIICARTDKKSLLVRLLKKL